MPTRNRSAYSWLTFVTRLCAKVHIPQRISREGSSHLALILLAMHFSRIMDSNIQGRSRHQQQTRNLEDNIGSVIADVEIVKLVAI